MNWHTPYNLYCFLYVVPTEYYPRLVHCLCLFRLTEGPLKEDYNGPNILVGLRLPVPVIKAFLSPDGLGDMVTYKSGSSQPLTLTGTVTRSDILL